MKTQDIIKEAHVGRNVELDALEITLIKSKWMKIVGHLSSLKNMDEELVVCITQFTTLIDKLCGEETLPLSKIHDNIFSSDPIEEDDLNQLVEDSTAIYDGMDDEERAERAIKRGSTDV